MHADARPTAGAHLFYLDDSGVLFCEATQELHLLNSAAAIIWSLLDEGLDEASASRAFSQACNVAPDKSREFVASAIELWRARGLLRGSVPVRADNPSPPTCTSATLPSWRDAPAASVHRYRILDTVFELRYRAQGQARIVHPTIAHLEIADRMQSQVVVTIDERDGRFVIYRDEEPFAACASEAELAPVMKALLWTTAVNRHAFLLQIHAAAIGDGDRCLLLPGAAGSGKSTLTAALVHAGYRLFSDDIALLAEPDFRVLPVPMAIGVKSSGIDAVAAAWPGLVGQPLHLRADGKRIAYLSPPSASLPANTSCPVAALVFPTHDAGGPTALEVLAKPVALERLLGQCVAVRTWLDAARVGALVDWIARMPCYSLRYEEARDVVPAIARLFAPTPSP